MPAQPFFRNSPRLYLGSECAAIDARVQRDFGASSDTLMQQAAAAAFAVLLERWPKARRLVVCAGVGNNAGDGYRLAALAARAQLEVTVIQLEGRRLVGAAGLAQQALPATVACLDLGTEDLPEAPDGPWAAAAAALVAADLVVDALLGIGLGSAPRPLFAALMDAVNASGLPVLALDVPSGLDADRACAPGVAIRAAATATFLVDKLALRTGAGAALAGAVSVHTLGIPARARQAADESAEAAGFPALRLADLCWPPLPVDVYKHRLGRVVVVGGDLGMGGAALLTADAALASGAGMVTLVTRPENVSAALARNPALMVLGTDRWPQVEQLIAQAGVVVCGPGLGQGAWGRMLFERVLQAPGRRVFDADALNLLAAAPQAVPGAILTPHGGEAARLLGDDAALVQADRRAAARALATRYQGTVVLKGPGSLIAGPGGALAASLEGQPGMATAGMGDVLAGLIAGVWGPLGVGSDSADLNSAQRAAEVAVTLHGGAAGMAGAAGRVRSLTATGLLGWLPAAIELAEAQGDPRA